MLFYFVHNKLNEMQHGRANQITSALTQEGGYLEYGYTQITHGIHYLSYRYNV